MTAHKHAALMALYAQDAAETDNPSQRWQFRGPKYAVWKDFDGSNPAWDTDREYRRKLKTIRIGEYDVPEPFHGELAPGQEYWVPNIIDSSIGSALSRANLTLPIGCVHVERGIVHLTYEAASLHAQALLSFTKKKP